jgi:sucrose phosphorylase
VDQTGEGRAINRHDYTLAELDNEDRPVVQRLLELIRLRNSHPAFDGTLDVELVGRGRLRLAWQNAASSCSLDVDLSGGRVSVDDGLRVDATEMHV